MKANLKWTALAIAITAFAAGAAHAQENGNGFNYDVDVDVDVDANANLNANVDLDWDWNKEINQRLDQRVDQRVTDRFERNHTENTTIDRTHSSDTSESFSSTVDMAYSASETHNLETNGVYEDINRNEYARSDVRSERDEHGVSVNIDKSISLDSDISFSGDPTLEGNIEIDSAAIALIDNRQSNTNNIGMNDMLTNDASIGDDVGSEASGNLQFNVAAGDNNVQDNAAALSAADASFAFGLADSEIFVNQYGAGNITLNHGVTNAAGLSGNAFSDASGNIGVNVAAGNNNQQKNALAASVATSAYAQATVSSNQISTGNYVENAGMMEAVSDTVDISLSGTVSGVSLGVGIGGYEGSSEGSYAGGGNSYQSSNFYADMWEGELHPEGPVIGHADYDIDSQGAVANPARPGVGGLGFDNVESGTYEGSESGDLAFVELSYSDLQASLAGSMSTTQWIVRDATNTAALSDSAFARASGNIGVNVAAGTGNLQANSLSMAVAQPSTGGGGGGGGE